jgi:hypothetical protein
MQVRNMEVRNTGSKAASAKKGPSHFATSPLGYNFVTRCYVRLAATIRFPALNLRLLFPAARTALPPEMAIVRISLIVTR